MKRTIKGKLRHIAYKLLPEKMYLKLWYFATLGKFPNLTNPRTFNEKMCWLKAYYKREKAALLRKCFDKYTVREYVSKKVGEQYLIPLIGVYKEAKDIPFNALPSEYIIKISQSCGMNYMVLDNNMIDAHEVKRKVSEWVIETKEYYKYLEEESFEYDGNPYILIEELLKNPDGSLVDDYKIYCFNGKAELIRVAADPIDELGKRKKKFVYNTYDREWQYLDMKTSDAHYPDRTTVIPKPKNLEELLWVAEKLSEDFPFARIDLYNINGKIYFGEITWFPGGGLDTFEPSTWDVALGERLHIPR